MICFQPSSAHIETMDDVKGIRFYHESGLLLCYRHCGFTGTWQLPYRSVLSPLYRPAYQIYCVSDHIEAHFRPKVGTIIYSREEERKNLETKINILISLKSYHVILEHEYSLINWNKQCTCRFSNQRISEWWLQKF